MEIFARPRVRVSKVQSTYVQSIMINFNQADDCLIKIFFGKLNYF